MRRRVALLIGLAALIPVVVVAVGVLALAIAYLGHPEELGRPSVNTTLEETLVLNSDRPVAVQALVVKVDPAA
jgi:hypothetical protein